MFDSNSFRLPFVTFQIILFTLISAEMESPAETRMNAFSVITTVHPMQSARILSAVLTALARKVSKEMAKSAKI